MSKTIDEQIAAAETKLKQLKSLAAKRAAAERAAAQTKERADDTRRKILLGAWALENMHKSDDKRLAYLAALDKYLTRSDDRALFNLDPMPAPPSSD